MQLAPPNGSAVPCRVEARRKPAVSEGVVVKCRLFKDFAVIRRPPSTHPRSARLRLCPAPLGQHEQRCGDHTVVPLRAIQTRRWQRTG